MTASAVTVISRSASPQSTHLTARIESTRASMGRFSAGAADRAMGLPHNRAGAPVGQPRRTGRSGLPQVQRLGGVLGARGEPGRRAGGADGEVCAYREALAPKPALQVGADAEE